MAQPIPLNLPRHDPREALYQRLENAPNEHAEALLATYEILQGLHDRGVLDIVRGVLGSGDKVLDLVVEAANTPEVIRGIRNLMVLAKIADALDPEVLEGLAHAVPGALARAKTEKPLGPVELAGKALNSDTRRALTVLTTLLESLGKSLGPAKSGEGH
jgi:uncharacterized protein YjgD (DUF1641 family)